MASVGVPLPIVVISNDCISGFYGACGEGVVQVAYKVGERLSHVEQKHIINTIPEGGSGLLYK